MRISNQNSDKDDKERMDAKSGNAKHSYVDQMNKILDELGDMLWHFVRKGHIKTMAFVKAQQQSVLLEPLVPRLHRRWHKGASGHLVKYFELKYYYIHTYYYYIHTYSY